MVNTKLDQHLWSPRSSILTHIHIFTYLYFAIGCSFVIFADSIFAALGFHTQAGADGSVQVLFALEKKDVNSMLNTWWLIPLSKWVITPVINGISKVNPLITGVITHLLSGMSHQVVIDHSEFHGWWYCSLKRDLRRFKRMATMNHGFPRQNMGFPYDLA